MNRCEESIAQFNNFFLPELKKSTDDCTHFNSYDEISCIFTCIKFTVNISHGRVLTGRIKPDSESLWVQLVSYGLMNELYSLISIFTPEQKNLPQVKSIINIRSKILAAYRQDVSEELRSSLQAKLMAKVRNKNDRERVLCSFVD